MEGNFNRTNLHRHESFGYKCFTMFKRKAWTETGRKKGITENLGAIVAHLLPVALVSARK